VSPRHPAPWKGGLPSQILLFSLVHFFYHRMGIVFDARPLRTYWQYIPVELLRHDLLRSLWFLHSQPPGFNAFLGAVVKLFAPEEGTAFHVLYVAMGFALYRLLFLCLRSFGVRFPIALGVSTWFMALPPFVLYEHWLYYTMPVSLALLASLRSIQNIFSRGWRRDYAVFSLSILTLCLTRSVFHLIYAVGAMLFLMAFRAPEWRRRACLPAIAVLLVSLLYVKNAILFGNFGASSWMGLGVSKIALGNLPESIRERAIADGRLPALARLPPYGTPPEEYPSWEQTPARFADVPILAKVRFGDKKINYNQWGYISLSKAYLHASLEATVLYPFGTLQGLAKAWFYYFKSASDYRLLDYNRRHIDGLSRGSDALFFFRWPWPLEWKGRTHFIYIGLLLGLPFLWFFGLRCMGRWRKGRSVQAVALLWVCANIAFIALIGNTFEEGENNRFRVMSDPLSACLLGIFFEERLRKRECKSGLGVRDGTRAVD